MAIALTRNGRRKNLSRFRRRLGFRKGKNGHSEPFLAIKFNKIHKHYLKGKGMGSSKKEQNEGTEHE